jgi:hypothetical protein
MSEYRSNLVKENLTVIVLNNTITVDELKKLKGRSIYSSSLIKKIDPNTVDLPCE